MGSLRQAHDHLRHVFKKSIRMKAQAQGFLIRKNQVVTNDGKEVVTFVLQDAQLEQEKDSPVVDIKVKKSVTRARCVATGAMLPVLQKMRVGDYLTVHGFYHDDPAFIDDEPEGIIIAEAIVKRGKNND